MESSQTLTAILVCTVPCVTHGLAVLLGIVISQRGLPRLTWERSRTGKPQQQTTLLKSRVSVRNADEPEEA